MTALQIHDVHEAPPCSRHPAGKHLIQLPEIQRQFLLIVPHEYTDVRSSGIPLVLAFHGFGDSPWYSNLLFDFSQHIDRYGWVGILPFGLNETMNNGLDGVGACCPSDCQGECCMNTPSLRRKGPTACGWRDNKKDVQFVEAMIKWTTENSCVDPEKVFAMGFSMGGIFVNYLACHSSHLIRGFAPVSGNPGFKDNGCSISRPISYVSTCGTADDVAYCQYLVGQTAELLTTKNNCSGAGPNGAAMTYARSATTSCKVWDCPQKNFMEVCMVEGLAHDVSGHLRPDNTSYLRPGSDLDAAEYAFQKFSLLPSVLGSANCGRTSLQEVNVAISTSRRPSLHSQWFKSSEHTLRLWSYGAGGARITSPNKCSAATFSHQMTFGLSFHDDS